MKLIQDLDPFDKDDAKTILQANMGSHILTDITTTTIRDLRLRIWDNLIVEIIRPTGTVLKNALINALRVYRLIEIVNLTDSGEGEIKQTLRGIPVLPSGIFKLPYKQVPPETPEPSDNPTIEEINIELKAKLDKLNAVYNEILGQYEELIREYNATSSETTFVPEYDTEGNITNPEEIPVPFDFYKFTDVRKDLLSEDVDEIHLLTWGLMMKQEENMMLHLKKLLQRRKILLKLFLLLEKNIRNQYLQKAFSLL